ncbi:NERD domain-containing protein [Streptomyces sp. NBC_01728]|uniref:nuclease-related domain-containing protein n=1 Tax=unclassified Streptomyces TaxID=2593676 RepID=UPI00225BDD46|nr:MULTISPECIES: nuclease-related domain-containing protein [unclassified Streptomyces]MCX4458524.1 NERD domain-containing protein [Streptomyces sp. NBC_01719]MCX4497881.1 NERD domain-containing protein [Streptomyces sp. NBC_01728]
MSLPLIAALIGAAIYAWNRLGQPGRRLKPGTPGASAFARAQQLRTPLVRLATALGIQTRAAKLADQYEIGGKGEQYVAGLLAELVGEGWVFLYDRRLPTGRTNIDGLAISPRGHVYVLDPKVMSARWMVAVDGGRLYHGSRDVTDRLDGLRKGARAVQSLLSTQPVCVAIIDGRLAARECRLNGVRIVAATGACAALRRYDAERLPRQRPANFPDIAARLLPPYTGR